MKFHYVDAGGAIEAHTSQKKFKQKKNYFFTSPPISLAKLVPLHLSTQLVQVSGQIGEANKFQAFLSLFFSY